MTPSEFTAEEWANRKVLRRTIVHHDPSCAGDCEHVFRCRATGGKHACGRHCGSCFGWSEDNRCNDCWCKAQGRPVEKTRTIKKFVRPRKP